MKLKQIIYTRKFNLGNYETQDIQLTAELDEDENVDEAFMKLKKKVLEMGEAKI